MDEYFSQVVNGQITSLSDINELLRQYESLPQLSEQEFYQATYLKSLLAYTKAVKDILPMERQVPGYICTLSESMYAAKMDACLSCLSNNVPYDHAILLRTENIREPFDGTVFVVRYGIGRLTKGDNASVRGELDTLWNKLQTACDRNVLVQAGADVDRMQSDHPEISMTLQSLKNSISEMTKNIANDYRHISVLLDKVEKDYQGYGYGILMQLNDGRSDVVTFNFGIQEFMEMQPERYASLLNEAKDLVIRE